MFLIFNIFELQILLYDRSPSGFIRYVKTQNHVRSGL